jgi:hypothetical protein
VIREAVFSLKNFLILKRITKKNIKIKFVGPVGLGFLAHIFGKISLPTPASLFHTKNPFYSLKVWFSFIELFLRYTYVFSDV